MSNRKAFSPVIIILAVFILLALALGAYYMKTQQVVKDNMTYETTPSAEPISESTDESTIQKEIDETNPGSIDADIQVFEKDTLSL